MYSVRDGSEEAMRMGYTLEINRCAMEEMCLTKNPVAKENKFFFRVNYKVMLLNSV